MGRGMQGYVLGPVRVEVPDHDGFMGTTKPAALFGWLVTSPGGQCLKSEIAQALYPGVAKAKGRIEKTLSVLRDALGEEIVPRGRSSICAIRFPRENLDLFRFLDGVRKAEHLRGMERIEQLGLALAEWSGRQPLCEMPGRAFQLRREEMRAKWLAAIVAQLDEAWRSREEKWLREESEKWRQQLPDEPRIFHYYLLAHGRTLPRGRLDRLIRQWIRCNGAPDIELQGVIGQVRGEVPQPRGTMFHHVPDQLPAPGRRPIGRGDLIRVLDEAVRERQEAGSGTLVVLSGAAGVGKSLVAHHLAHHMRPRFPDGALYAALNGFAEGDAGPVDPEHVLDAFLAQLPPYSRAVGVEGKSAALRSALAYRSVLIVLDDAFDTQQILPLLPGVGTSTVVVTSRNTLGGLRSRKDVVFRKVEPLPQGAAVELLQEGFAAGDRGKYAHALSDLVRLCDGLPLALAVVARRLEIQRSVSAVHDLVRELTEERRRTDALHLSTGELSVRSALNCSVRVLSDDARRLFRQLALHPGPTIGWDAVMDLGLAGEGMRADRALEELEAANLVELRAERYFLHDLVRAFARHHVRPPVPGDSQEFEQETVRQVLEHQLQNVRACDRLLGPRRSLPIREPDGVRVVEPADPEHAVEWLDDEYDTVLRCIQLAIGQGQYALAYVWLLPMALVTYQWHRHRLSDAAGALERAAEVAEAVASPLDCAMVYRMRAGTEWHRGRYRLGVAYLRRAVLLSQQENGEAARRSLALSIQALAVTLRKCGEEVAAEDHFHRALSLYRELADAVGEAEVLNGIGALHNDRGEHRDALRWCTEALDVIDRTTEQNARADVLFTLAKIHLARSERDEALPLFRGAAEIFRERGYQPLEDKVRWHYADVLLAVGHRQEAVSELERVLELRERMGGEGVAEVRERLEMLR